METRNPSPGRRRATKATAIVLTVIAGVPLGLGVVFVMAAIFPGDASSGHEPIADATGFLILAGLAIAVAIPPLAGALLLFRRARRPLTASADRTGGR